MADEPKQLEQITSEDVDKVTEQLKEWMPTLPEQDQLVLGWILTRAAAAGDVDVSQYAERSAGAPVSTLMAEAAGLQDVSAHQLPGRIGPITIWTFRW